MKMAKILICHPVVPNTDFAAFFEIYKICNPSHRSDLKISAKIHPIFFVFCSKSCKNRYFSTLFIEFRTDFDEILSEFRRIFEKMMEDL